MPTDALAVHGLTAESPAEKPLFAEIAYGFLAFVGDAPLVAHNAGFDIAFLNVELKRAGKPPIATERVVDTLVLARRKHPAGGDLFLCRVPRARAAREANCTDLGGEPWFGRFWRPRFNVWCCGPSTMPEKSGFACDSGLGDQGVR